MHDRKPVAFPDWITLNKSYQPLLFVDPHVFLYNANRSQESTTFCMRHNNEIPARKRRRTSTPITACTSFPTGRLPQHLPLQDFGRPKRQGLVAILRVSY